MLYLGAWMFIFKELHLVHGVYSSLQTLTKQAHISKSPGTACLGVCATITGHITSQSSGEGVCTIHTEHTHCGQHGGEHSGSFLSSVKQ